MYYLIVIPDIVRRCYQYLHSVGYDKYIIS